MGKIKDLTGQRFGRLVAVELLEERAKNGDCIWRCVCDCGGITCVRADFLTRKLTKSCGCLAKEWGYKLSAVGVDTLIKKAKERIYTGKKKCSVCKEIKNMDCFFKEKASADGHCSSCRSCRGKIRKAFYMSEKGVVSLAKQILKETTSPDTELPPELIEARAELIKIRRKIKEMTP